MAKVREQLILSFIKSNVDAVFNAIDVVGVDKTQYNTYELKCQFILNSLRKASEQPSVTPAQLRSFQVSIELFEPFLKVFQARGI